ncbi:MAG: HDIG domain-containing protein [Candidatus Aminicenantes bacterium]|nr:HDIG domain-containing protein [Candidatus Aminicenantes bacterium]
MIALKKFKLFKASSRPAARTETAAKPGVFKRIGAFLLNPFLWLGLFILVMSYLLSQLPSKALPTPEVGDIAPRDIAAPDDLTIVDMEMTLAKRREAEEAVLPVYALDPSVLPDVRKNITEVFELGRGWNRQTEEPGVEALQKAVAEKFDVDVPLDDLAYLLQSGFPAALEDPLINILGKILDRGVLVSKGLLIHRERERGFVLIRPGEPEKTVRASEFFDLSEATERIAAEIDQLNLPSRRKTLLRRLGEVFLQPNITQETVETETRRRNAGSGVEPVFYQIKKGKVIVRQGDEVTAEGVRQIRMINSSLRTTPSWLLNVLGTFVLLALLFTAMWFYIQSLEKPPESVKILVLLGVLLVMGVLLDRLFQLLGETISPGATWFALTHRDAYAYAIPLQFGSLLFAFLTSIPVTLVFVILNSLAAGYLFQADYYLTIFFLIGGLAAIYGVKHFQKQKRTTVLRAGLFLVTPINVLLILALHLVKRQGGDAGLLLSETFMAVAGGVVAGAAAFVLLPILETTFGFLTAPRLSEITNSETPILRQMALRAPGTYHHSLVVATLAEKAAEALKVDSLLVRAGALYHDIGKLKRPEYFYENRGRNLDTHSGLTPSMSRLVIVNHVKDGVDMARRLRLPSKVREIIEQHHGTNLVRYFFQKAKERYDPEMQTVGEEHFRYPGPTPRSKEAALVMMADAVEAASRSLRHPSSDNLKRVIQELFDNFIREGELDESGLSLKDIKDVGHSFLSALESIHHPRVTYPRTGFEPDSREGTAERTRKTKDNDLHPQPAKPSQDSDREP